MYVVFVNSSGSTDVQRKFLSEVWTNNSKRMCFCGSTDVQCLCFCNIYGDFTEFLRRFYGVFAEFLRRFYVIFPEVRTYNVVLL